MIWNENTTVYTHTHTHIHACKYIHTHTHTHLHKSIITETELIAKAKKHTDLRGSMRKEEREGEQECLGGNKKTKNKHTVKMHT